MRYYLAAHCGIADNMQRGWLLVPADKPVSRLPAQYRLIDNNGKPLGQLWAKRSDLAIVDNSTPFHRAIVATVTARAKAAGNELPELLPQLGAKG